MVTLLIADTGKLDDLHMVYAANEPCLCQRIQPSRKKSTGPMEIGKFEPPTLFPTPRNKALPGGKPSKLHQKQARLDIRKNPMCTYDLSFCWTGSLQKELGRCLPGWTFLYPLSPQPRYNPYAITITASPRIRGCWPKATYGGGAKAIEEGRAIGEVRGIESDWTGAPGLGFLSENLLKL